jgi:hypothetical protein
MSRPSGAVPGQVWVAAGRRTIDRNSFDASAVNKIADRVAALVVRDAQASVCRCSSAKARLWTRHILLIVPLS